MNILGYLGTGRISVWKGSLLAIQPEQYGISVASRYASQTRYNYFAASPYRLLEVDWADVPDTNQHIVNWVRDYWKPEGLLLLNAAMIGRDCIDQWQGQDFDVFVNLENVWISIGQTATALGL